MSAGVALGVEELVVEAMGTGTAVGVMGVVAEVVVVGVTALVVANSLCYFQPIWMYHPIAELTW
jgi:hypothetical protein